MRMGNQSPGRARTFSTIVGPPKGTEGIENPFSALATWFSPGGAENNGDLGSSGSDGGGVSSSTVTSAVDAIRKTPPGNLILPGGQMHTNLEAREEKESTSGLDPGLEAIHVDVGRESNSKRS